MPRIAAILTDRAIHNLKPTRGQRWPENYTVGAAKGLSIQVTPNGGKSWLLRYTVPGTGRDGIQQKRREMGLGTYPDVSLKEARELASNVHKKLAAGADPIAERRAARSETAAQLLRAITFEQATRQWLDKKALEWKNPNDFPRWSRQFETRLYPALGKVQLARIGTPHLVRVLEPLWLDVPDTAKKLRAYIGNVFEFAIAKTYIDGPNPAPSKTHMDTLAGDASRIVKKGHHAALKYEDVARFMARLHKVKGLGARALEFTILTAARSGEVRGATWDEIDLDAAVWTIPAERMKAGREHRVPLSKAAVALLKALPRFADTNFVFVSARGGELSDMTLAKVIKDMHASETKAERAGFTDSRQGDKVATPHGFRSTFRDWAAETTHYPHAVAEMALAHTIKNAAEAAYRRGDLFQKRRALMDDWAVFCDYTFPDK